MSHPPTVLNSAPPPSIPVQSSSQPIVPQPTTTTTSATITTMITPASTTAATAPSTHPLSSASPSPSPTLAAPLVGVSSALSPPTGIPTWSTRQVSESLFDFLHWEMIAYWTKQLNHTLRGEEARLIAKKIHGKIEGMGFQIGQRYVERYSKDHPLQEQPLDMVKFMCKEFWSVREEHIMLACTHQRDVN